MDNDIYWRFVMSIAKRLFLVIVMCSTNVSASILMDLREYHIVDFTNSQQGVKGLPRDKLQIKTDIGATVLRRTVGIAFSKSSELNIVRQLMIKEDFERLKEPRTVGSHINSSIILTNSPPVIWFMGVALIGLVSFGRRKPVMP